MTNNWTVTDIAERFEEAAATLRRLPSVKVRGYFNAWPQIIRTVREKLDEDKEAYRHSPPQPDAISRMEETIQWIFFLESEQEKRLIWLRAEGVKWKQICGRIGCGRTKAWHLWVVALLKIATRLNNGGIPKRNGGRNVRTKKD
jgi:hypothetical protein